jgi:hypothetical protein
MGANQRVVFAVNVILGSVLASSELLPHHPSVSTWCEAYACTAIWQANGQSLLQNAYNVIEHIARIDEKQYHSSMNPPPEYLLGRFAKEDPNRTLLATGTEFIAAKEVQHELSSGPLFRKLRNIPIGVYALLLFFLFSVMLVLHCRDSEQLASEKVPREFYCRDQQGKVYAYCNEELLTWQLLFSKTPSIVMSWRVWIVVPCVLGTSCGFVSMIALQTGYSSFFDMGKVDEFGRYLRVFIAFMLGLFMNGSFQRWNTSVNNFKGYLTSVKQMMWSVRVMKIRQELVEELQRKCLLACYVLEAEMRTDIGCEAEVFEAHWDATWDFLVEEKLLTEEEEKVFRSECDRERRLVFDSATHSAVIWAWVGQLLEDIRREPGVLVPMYVRLVGLCHSCLQDVDQLKTCTQVQVPFTYAYLLATIVHLNNFMLAVCSGLQIGASLMNMKVDEGKAKESTSTSVDEHVTRDLYKSAEILVMQTLLLLIQPLMYQACLVIAHVLNHPFGDHACHLPTMTFILQLRDELDVSADSFKDAARLKTPDLVTDIEKEEDSSGSSGGGDDDDDGDD